MISIGMKLQFCGENLKMYETFFLEPKSKPDKSNKHNKHNKVGQNLAADLAANVPLSEPPPREPFCFHLYLCCDHSKAKAPLRFGVCGDRAVVRCF